MLRNLVTSLLEHEQIRTTLPKARDTARLAEKVITLGKKGGRSAETSAKAFLLNPSLIPKLFGPLASRYSERQGGYTRIHKYGNRQGDNAPQAILELVDNPKDIRLEMTSRAIGREVLKEKLKKEQPISLINKGAQGVEDLIKSERDSVNPKIGFLRPMTRWNLQKVLRFRSADALSSMATKAGEYMDTLLATPLGFRQIHEELKEKNPRAKPRRLRAGETAPGDTRAALDLARGALGHRRPPPRGPILDMKTVFGRKYRHP